MTKNSIHPETREKFVSPLPLWVLTIARDEENIKKLKQLTGILNFRIRVEDLRVTKKDIQCFRCQRYGHKADFCQLKRKCVKCGEDHLARECPKSPTTKATCANCQGEHPANFKKCPAAIKYKERKSAPKEQENVNLNINSNTEFPSLPSRPQRPQTNSTTTPTANSDASGLKEIIQLLTSGKLKTYITKFKGLMASVNQETDTLSKMTTFFVGLMDIFED